MCYLCWLLWAVVADRLITTTGRIAIDSQRKTSTDFYRTNVFRTPLFHTGDRTVRARSYCAVQPFPYPHSSRPKMTQNGKAKRRTKFFVLISTPDNGWLAERWRQTARKPRLLLDKQPTGTFLHIRYIHVNSMCTLHYSSRWRSVSRSLPVFCSRLTNIFRVLHTKNRRLISFRTRFNDFSLIGARNVAFKMKKRHYTTDIAVRSK